MYCPVNSNVLKLPRVFGLRGVCEDERLEPKISHEGHACALHYDRPPPILASKFARGLPNKFTLQRWVLEDDGGVDPSRQPCLQNDLWA